MKDSDYKALSLTRRQYDQLLEYVNAVKKQGGKLQPQSPTQQSVDTFKQRQSQKAKK
jgi:phage terminase small subunit